MNDWLDIQSDPVHTKREREKARELRNSDWWKNLLAQGICHYCQGHFEPEELTEDRIQSLTAVQKEKAAEPLRFWRLLGECFEKKNWEVEFSEILKEFNEIFPHLDFLTYEFHCFQNVEELGLFLQKRYPELTEDDEEALKQVFKTEDFDSAAFSAYCEEAFDYYGAE